MNEKVEKAVAAWNTAPVHVQIMAGSYVNPLLAALVAMAAEISTLKEKVENGSR